MKIKWVCLLTCAGRSLPLKTSSHGNTNSPTASTETTAETQRGFGGKEGKGQTEIDYTSLSTHQPTQHYRNMDLHYMNKKEESIPPKDTKQRGGYLENWLKFSHSSLPVNTVYNVYKITAQVMNGTQWASQSGVSSG